MQLGGRDLSVQDTTAPLAEMTGGQSGVMGQDSSGVHSTGGIAWPLNLFDISSLGSGTA